MPLPEGEFKPDESEFGDYADVITAEPDAPTPADAEPQLEDGFGTFDISQTESKIEPTKLFNEAGEELPTFDQKYTEPLMGLMYMGALTNSFTWQGHRFRIRTLTIDEELAVALITKVYQGTLGEMKAYSTAMAALSVMSIDNEALPAPVGPTSDDNYGWAFQKFDYARKHWFAFTVEVIYKHFVALEQKAAEVMGAMEKASGQGDSTPGSNTNSE